MDHSSSILAVYTDSRDGTVVKSGVLTVNGTEENGGRKFLETMHIRESETAPSKELPLLHYAHFHIQSDSEISTSIKTDT